MTGAITVAWHAASQVMPASSGKWFPYICAFAWAIISYLISRSGLVETSGDGKVSLGTSLQALFIGFLNALVLAGAVVGTANVTGSPLDQRQASETTKKTAPAPQP